MLKPRKQCKRVPITLETGLLKVLKGRVLQFDIFSCEDSYDELQAYFYRNGSDHFGKKDFLSIEGQQCFASIDRLVKRLEDKGVLIFAPYECSTWVVAGDNIGMRKAAKYPGPVGRSRLERERKWRREEQC